MTDNVSAVFGTHDEKTLAQLRDVGSRAEQVALMADGHVGYVMHIGGVAAYDNKASVVGVGFDIACGNAALRTNLSIGDFDRSTLARGGAPPPWRAAPARGPTPAPVPRGGAPAGGGGRPAGTPPPFPPPGGG